MAKNSQPKGMPVTYCNKSANPAVLIGSDQAEKFVLVVGDGNKVRRQSVTLGPRSHGLRIVREGLKGHEQIIVRGIQRVRPGIEVKTEKAKSE